MVPGRGRARRQADLIQVRTAPRSGSEAVERSADVPSAADRSMKTILTLVLLALLPSAALAQQSTIYGPDGKVTGRVATDSQGSTTIYDAAGRVTGRTSTDSQGTTTIYDASGRKAGSVTGKSPATK